MSNSLERLQQWLESKEGEHFEFKEAKNHYDFEELCKYCAALANEGGGRVVLGVTDSRPRHVVGSTAFDQPERTRNGLIERLHLRIDFEGLQHPDGRVLVFDIPSRPIGVPVQYKGIEDNQKEGSPLQELMQVLPALSRPQVQTLLRELRTEVKAYPVGKTKAGRWYPGPEPGTIASESPG